MVNTSPIISWGILIAVVGVWYYLNNKKKVVPDKKAVNATLEKSKNVFLTGGSGTDAGEAKKKKKKKNKAALSNTAPKEVVSTDDQVSDGEVAEEVNPADVVKRLQSIKNGGNGKGTASRQGRQGSNLAPSHSPFSQTSSTGADADIDEEESTPLVRSAISTKGSSTDPSDMLEAPTSAGPAVLKIGAPIQPPRQPKTKSAPKDESGLHANKNQKKKEKKKAEKDAARADQKSRFEQHRQTMRAEEAAQQKTKPTPARAAASSAWTQANGGSAPVVAAPVASAPAGSLLDTFVSEDEQAQQNAALGDSWEAVPLHVQEPEPEWSEVKSKKDRKPKKAATPTNEVPGSDYFKSSDEYTPSVQAAPPVKQPVRQPVKPAAPKKEAAPKGGNAYSMLETASDAKTTSGSDWSQVDNLDNWAVHPESD
ncbi:hypothetical protein EDC01DRAFT_270199 [Geopyxis carbonaria]|nr:hypothetical protein EDC01DRAFT_270199 [Geopyxis carbonaria]